LNYFFEGLPPSISGNRLMPLEDSDAGMIASNQGSPAGAHRDNRRAQSRVPPDSDGERFLLDGTSIFHPSGLSGDRQWSRASFALRQSSN
jgi:hypothetical protein